MSLSTIFLLILILLLLVACFILLLRQEHKAGPSEHLDQLRAEIKDLRQDHTTEARRNREEISHGQQAVSQALTTQLGEISRSQQAQLGDITKNNNEEMARLRQTMDEKLSALQQVNEQKLEQMRLTVDEKLSNTLNKRLGESFNLVSERLERVNKGLGEMQTLTENITDVKRIFSNVKTRGVWGEVQLGHILEDILTPEQYETNFAPAPRSRERVEFAVRLPRRDEDNGFVYLPIDSKFPVEDYQRLLAAEEAGDALAMTAARSKLEAALKTCATDIATKYIRPPRTLEYAILFLPTESLYAESLRLPSFLEYARAHQVMVAGPTNLAALLNSIKMGFSTLAIQEKSGEIRKLLAAVKGDMQKFAANLEAAQTKLNEAGKAITLAADRTQKLNRKLNKVDALTPAEAASLPNGESAATNDPA